MGVILKKFIAKKLNTYTVLWEWKRKRRLAPKSVLMCLRPSLPCSWEIKQTGAHPINLYDIFLVLNLRWKFKGNLFYHLLFSCLAIILHFIPYGFPYNTQDGLERKAKIIYSVFFWLSVFLKWVKTKCSKYSKCRCIIYLKTAWMYE